MKLECVQVFHCAFKLYPRLKMLVAGIGKNKFI